MFDCGIGWDSRRIRISMLFDGNNAERDFNVDLTASKNRIRKSYAINLLTSSTNAIKL